MVALIAVASAAYASDSAWLISVKAVSAAFGGGAALTVGVGTTTDTAQSWPTSVGSTANASNTAAYGDLAGQYRARKDVTRDLGAEAEGANGYGWDLLIGARADYAPATINICIWNNRTASLGAGGELNHALAYAFYKGDTLLAWFSDAGLVHDLAVSNGGMNAALWADANLLIKNSSSWSPTSAATGFYVTDTVTRSATGSFGDLGAYRFEAFAPTVPEPGSFMALGSGLIGLAGFAIRRRK
jgi:hypothetical protein